MHKRIIFLSVLVLVTSLTLIACEGVVRVEPDNGGWKLNFDVRGDPLTDSDGDIIVQQQQDSGNVTQDFFQSNWILVLGMLLVFIIVIVALTRDRRRPSHHHDEDK